MAANSGAMTVDARECACLAGVDRGAQGRLRDRGGADRSALQRRAHLGEFRFDEVHAGRRDPVVLEPRRHAELIEVVEGRDGDRRAVEVLRRRERRGFRDAQLRVRVLRGVQRRRRDHQHRETVGDGVRHLHDVGDADVEVAAEHGLRDRRAVGQRRQLCVDARVAEEAALDAVVRDAERVDRIGSDPNDGRCGRRCRYGRRGRGARLRLAGATCGGEAARNGGQCRRTRESSHVDILRRRTFAGGCPRPCAAHKDRREGDEIGVAWLES